MPGFTRTQEQALEAAREVWRAGGNKAAGVKAGEQVIHDSTPPGHFPQYPGSPRMMTAPLVHSPADTPVKADLLRRYLAEYGNYPSGMSLCEAAGINGDAADGCPFAGEDFCNCDEEI